MDKDKDLLKDFFREQKEKNEILKMPMNSLAKMALANVKESELTKRVKKQYEGFTLSQFLNHTAKKNLDN